ncbi:MAG: hypothetical protein V4727_13230 [Verrucomicrobiota bacterium]
MADSKTNFELVEGQEAMDLVPTWELEWWWIALPAAFLILLILLVCLLLKKSKVHDPNKAKREAFYQAMTELAKLDASLGKENVIMVSLVMRKYLANSMNEPALYETHEEFIGRHDAIKDLDAELKLAISNYFSELAAIKYGPDDEKVFNVDYLKHRSVKLLERIQAS